MTTSTGPESREALSSGLTCSAWAREQHLDPVGSAGSYRGYLLVEWPLPWPRDLAEIPPLAPVAEAARSAGMRLQGLVPASADDVSRVAAYRWPRSGQTRLSRAELTVERAEVVAAALAVLGETPGQADSIEVLICTHGRRDRCCGSLGTSLAQELSGDPCPLGDGVRVWRTSHTGGHRFAPTAVVLPQGTSWAFCDKSALERIVRREGPMDDLLARYRGCSAMASGAAQALERAVLGEVGWPLFEMERRVEDLGSDKMEIAVDHPEWGRTVWEASVRSELVLLPECGQLLQAATKREPRWVVENLRRC